MTPADAGRRGALAAAARVARGRFLLFCDADDIVADDWIERMVAALEQHPAVGGHLDEESLNPPSMRAWRPLSTPGQLPAPFGLLPALIGANCGVWREAYEKVGGFDENFRGVSAEETDLFWRIQLAGYQLGYAPAAVVAYRHRATLPGILRQCAATAVAGPTWSPATSRLGLLPAESWRDAFSTAGWLTVHVVDPARGPIRRVNYLRTLAHVLGQLEGSRETGVLHIRRNPRPGTVHRPPGVPGEWTRPRRATRARSVQHPSRALVGPLHHPNEGAAGPWPAGRSDAERPGRETAVAQPRYTSSTPTRPDWPRPAPALTGGVSGNSWRRVWKSSATRGRVPRAGPA